MIGLFLSVLLFSFVLSFIEPIFLLLTGLFQFIKNNWYIFLIVLYFLK